MPRPRQDGTPARVPNRRKLSDAFVRSVQPDPDRVVMVWDTLQWGLALRVQPTGHLAWKCVYTIRGRGLRWYHLGNARAIPLADARKLAAKTMVAVAEGNDRRARRRAQRCRVEVGIAQPVGSDAVKVRRRDHATERVGDAEAG